MLIKATGFFVILCTFLKQIYHKQQNLTVKPLLTKLNSVQLNQVKSMSTNRSSFCVGAVAMRCQNKFNKVLFEFNIFRVWAFWKTGSYSVRDNFPEKHAITKKL